MKDARKMRASRRVLKKLSAVRAVLSKDEREVLDAIVLREVRAHQMTSNPASKTAGNNQAKSHQTSHRRKGKAAMAMPKNPISKATNKATAKGQVKAHAMPKSAVNKATAKGQVKAHAMPKSAVNKATSKATAKGQVKAHAMPKSAVNKATSKATAKGQVKVHAMPKSAVNKATSKATAKRAVKAHEMVNTEPSAQQVPATTVPPVEQPVELPKVEFDPTVEQYKPVEK